ncbi:hypothetical protein [Deinococcus sp. JMULE3]|uniref:hypothetical protein n=1 Tax=Deinococcus sp. JMULE3 TaxID=2518341 RepID=UPI0015769841|nr:hypothetical protein [Deinococcus sp. JMULE3]NTY00453.1 hypothetical protein [Deinococcus sp. JMULE3]
MTTPPTNPNSTNALGLKHVYTLASREGVCCVPLPYDPARPYWPSHVCLDGLGARVMARHAEPGKRSRFTFDKLQLHRGIEWLVLVCLPSGPADDPVLYRIPRSVWQHCASITIDLHDSSAWPVAYRWSPPTRQEERRNRQLDLEVWQIADELAAAASGTAFSSGSGWAGGQ